MYRLQPGIWSTIISGAATVIPQASVSRKPGCTLSSAIASNLAKGFSLEESVERAKDYISGALAAMLDLGKGSGPMDHGFAIDNAYTKEAEV